MSTEMFFDKDGEPLDLMTWATLFENQAYKRIALTTIASAADPAVTYNVSTIWTGGDHGFHDDPPLIFETMVFGDGNLDQAYNQYSTREQAESGHQEMVAVVAATVDNAVVMDAAGAEWDAKLPQGGDHR